MAFTLREHHVGMLEAEQYHYIRTLGHGQYGLVLLATKNKRKLALKVTRDIKSFHSEVLALTQIGDHKYHRSWSVKILYVIDLEYIHGRSLLEILMETPFSEVRAHRYFCHSSQQ